MERVTLVKPPKQESTEPEKATPSKVTEKLKSAFESAKATGEQKFFSSGSTLLDLVLGGGWAQSRIVNVVGDRSSGKTLLATEAAAGFLRANPKGKVGYVEAESAFLVSYADQVGLPKHKYSLIQNIDTVEGIFDHISQFIESAKGRPVLYVIDSLDALSTESEFDRDIHKEPLIATKARIMSEVLRRIVRYIAAQDCTLFVVSQVRDNIGAQFGGKAKTGGGALNFYISQELWLLETGKIEKTVRGIKRPIGIEVRARDKKNKVGSPYREAPLSFLFEYGIDDELSNLKWLELVKVTDIEGVPLETMKNHIRRLRDKRELDELKQLAALIRAETVKIWNECEADLAPRIRKEEML